MVKTGLGKTALGIGLRYKTVLCFYPHTTKVWAERRKKLDAFLNSAMDGERSVSDSGRLTPE